MFGITLISTVLVMSTSDIEKRCCLEYNSKITAAAF